MDDQLIRITRSRDGDCDDDANVGQEEDDEDLSDAREEDASDEEESAQEMIQKNLVPTIDSNPEFIWMRGESWLELCRRLAERGDARRAPWII